MPVQAGSHKGPGLMKNKGHGHEDAQVQGQFEGRQERRGDAGGDHAGAFRHGLHQRLGHQGVQLPGKVEQPQKHHENRGHGLE